VSFRDRSAWDQKEGVDTLPEDGGELEEDPAQSSVELDAAAEAAHFSMLAHDLRGPFSVMLAEAHEIARTLSRSGVSYDLTRINAAADLMNLRIGEVGWGLKHGVFFHDGTPPPMARVPVENILGPLRALYEKSGRMVVAGSRNGLPSRAGNPKGRGGVRRWLERREADLVELPQRVDTCHGAVDLRIPKPDVRFLLPNCRRP
jgi:hypothetical protein